MGPRWGAPGRDLQAFLCQTKPLPINLLRASSDNFEEAVSSIFEVNMNGNIMPHPTLMC